MKTTFIIIGALVAGISAANAQLITGSMAAVDWGTGANSTSSSLELSSLNLITTSETGDLASLVPALSDLTAYTGVLTGLSATAKTENINDFFEFSSPDSTFGTSGTSPDDRFGFDLTTIAEALNGTYVGTGTIVDTDGVYAPTAASFTIGFSSSSNYSFTVAADPVPEPTTVMAGALMLLPLGVSAVRILRRKQTA